MSSKLTTTSRLLFSAGLCAIALAVTPAAASSAPFDGSWSVKIVTQKGTCDSGASVPIRVTNGAIASDLSIVKASGQVATSLLGSPVVGFVQPPRTYGLTIGYRY